MSHQVLVNMSSIPHPTAKVADILCIMHDTYIDDGIAAVCACPLLLFVHLLALWVPPPSVFSRVWVLPSPDDLV